MTLDEFMILVDRMREAQRSYFATRDLVVLSRSRSLERQVDQAIQEHRAGQGSLFPSAGEPRA